LTVLDEDGRASLGTVYARVYPERFQYGITSSRIGTPVCEGGDLGLSRLARDYLEQRGSTVLAPLCLAKWILDLHPYSANDACEDLR